MILTDSQLLCKLLWRLQWRWCRTSFLRVPFASPLGIQYLFLLFSSPSTWLTYPVRKTLQPATCRTGKAIRCKSYGSNVNSLERRVVRYRNCFSASLKFHHSGGRRTHKKCLGFRASIRFTTPINRSVACRGQSIIWVLFYWVAAPLKLLVFLSPR